MCFCEIYEIFKKTFFVQYLRTTASVTWVKQSGNRNMVFWSKFPEQYSFFLSV